MASPTLQEYIFILAKTNYITIIFAFINYFFMVLFLLYMVHAHTRKYKLFFNFPNTNNARRIYGQHYLLYVYFFILLLLLSCHYRSHIAAPRGRRQSQIQTTLSH